MLEEVKRKSKWFQIVSYKKETHIMTVGIRKTESGTFIEQSDMKDIIFVHQTN